MLTSHIPHNQTIKTNTNNSFYTSAGGGMAPEIPNGYSISYFPFDENTIFLHVSSLKNGVTISTKTLLNGIIEALDDIKELFEKENLLKNKKAYISSKITLKKKDSKS